MCPLELNSAKILVVDDEPASVRLLQKMLARAGYVNVVGTTDPRVALDVYRELQPDLLLLDLHMPGLSGIEVMEILREESPTSRMLPIIAVTGNPCGDTRVRALLNGVYGLLNKPFEYLDTILRIRNLLELRLLIREMEERLDKGWAI